MTTTTQTHGGGAQPASIDTSGKVTGGAALRVYGFDSEADAQAAGYVCEGGPAMSVALITDAQLSSGAWRLEGDPSGTAVYTAPANMPIEGGYAVPVYPVNGWGSAPAPVGPQFSAAEVGTVNALTVVVTFDSNISASDYSAGVTIKVNGTSTSITSATRQANHAIVYYVIPVLWHGSGDTVTWEYASGSGNIVAESDSTLLGDVSAQSVTNNCEYAALLDLQADTLALNDGDPVGTWADQSGQGHNFTQTGSARPTKQTVSSKSAVVLDGVDDWMLGSNFADNPGELLVFAAMIFAQCNALITKMDGAYSDAGWDIAPRNIGSLISNAGGVIYKYNDVDGTNFPALNNQPVVLRYAVESYTSLKAYINGNQSNNGGGSGTVTDISNSQPVRIGRDNQIVDGYGAGSVYALMLISPLPNATNTAALEARLAARYGITL